MKVLVTGGAGFIGSYTVDVLLNKGRKVRFYENLDKQVHGQNTVIPDYLNPEAEFIKGDIRDRDALRKALGDNEAVYHLTAAVGVGWSIYESTSMWKVIHQADR